jgi:hypothetical protein
MNSHWTQVRGGRRLAVMGMCHRRPPQVHKGGSLRGAEAPYCRTVDAKTDMERVSAGNACVVTLARAVTHYTLGVVARVRAQPPQEMVCGKDRGW